MRFLAAALFLAALVFPAAAQQKNPGAVNGCQYIVSFTPLANWQVAPFQCDANGALKISGTISAASAATAQATLPSLSPGINNLYETLSGGQYVQPIFGTTIVSLSNGLPVNVVAGTISATSSVNAVSTLPTLAPGAQTPQASLAGAAYVQQVFGSASGGGTQVDGTHGLPVSVMTSSITTTPSGTQTISGAVNVTSGSVTSIQGTSPWVVSGSITTTPSGPQTVTITGALPAGANVLGTVTTTPSGTQAVSGTVTANQSGAWNIGTVTALTGGSVTSTDGGAKINSASMPAGGAGLTGWLSAIYYQLTQTLTATLTGALPAGANILGTVTSTQGASPWLVGLLPQTTGGLSITSSIIGAGASGYLVKSAAGQVYHLSAFSNTTTLAYLKIYNTASVPTCGSGTPVARYEIPASGGFVSEISNGIAFSSGIGFCVTGGQADSDTTAPGASNYIVNFYYR